MACHPPPTQPNSNVPRSGPGFLQRQRRLLERDRPFGGAHRHHGQVVFDQGEVELQGVVPRAQMNDLRIASHHRSVGASKVSLARAVHPYSELAHARRTRST